MTLCHGIERGIFELDTLSGGPEQQAAAAHVTATDERRRERKTRPDHAHEGVHVLGRRDATEQNNARVLLKRRVERREIAFERHAVARIVRVHVH